MIYRTDHEGQKNRNGHFPISQAYSGHHVGKNIALFDHGAINMGLVKNGLIQHASRTVPTVIAFHNGDREILFQTLIT